MFSRQCEIRFIDFIFFIQNVEDDRPIALEHPDDTNLQRVGLDEANLRQLLRVVPQREIPARATPGGQDGEKEKVCRLQKQGPHLHVQV